MSQNLFDLELANIEDETMHRATENSSTKRDSNHRKLAARRAIEDYLEEVRLRREIGAEEIDFY